MERAIEIVPRYGDPVLESLRYRRPDIVDDTHGQIAIPGFIGRDDPGGDQIVNLFYMDLLLLKLFPEGIKPLDAALDADEGDVISGKLLCDRCLYLLERCLELRAANIDLTSKPLVVLRIEVLE